MMCEICNRTPCLNECPNAIPPKDVYVCRYCGEAIFEGEYFVNLNDEYYHRECAEDIAFTLLLEECGAEEGIAEVCMPC